MNFFSVTLGGLIPRPSDANFLRFV
ncbi:uncharacterized protein METZ01_LOCUS170386 [marine metagenome]|uniref:Uncharacterized protein n=1 Tax=marine metagenome TaxID=408172 RepID=A0A382BVK4_9ZZZZ